MIETQEFTVEQVYNALAQDGFEHIRGSWTATDMEGAITGACVLGQGAINLGVADGESDSKYWVRDYNILDQLNKFTVPKENRWAVDDADDTYQDYLKEWEDQEPEAGYEFAPLPVGATIIFWNDKEADNGYYLNTYADVVAMVKEVLEPHFAETVELAKVGWEIAVV